jgi:hypothetical protein
MSRDSDSVDEPTLREAITKPAIKTYMVVGFLALFLYYLLMSERTGSIAALITVLVGIPGLLGWGYVWPIFFLILNTYLVYDPGFTDLLESLSFTRYGPYGHRRDYDAYSYLEYRSRSTYGFSIQEFLVVLAVMAYLMAQYRIFSLLRSGMPDDPAPLRKGQTERPQPRRPTVHFTDRELGRVLTLGGVSVVIGQLSWWILTALDVERGFSATWGFWPRVFGRGLLFFWILGSGLLISRAAFSYIRWCRMSPTEARLIVQDAYWQETRREQERIYRWRRWYQDLQARRAAKAARKKGDKL